MALYDPSTYPINQALFTPDDGEEGTLTITGDYFYPSYGFVAVDANTLTYNPPAHAFPPNNMIAEAATVYSYSRSGGVTTVTLVSGGLFGVVVGNSGAQIRVALTDSYSASKDNPQGPTYDIPPYVGSYPTASLQTDHLIDDVILTIHAEET